MKVSQIVNQRQLWVQNQNYRYIQSNAGKGFGKKGSKSKTIKLLKSASNLVCRIDWVWYFLQKLLLLAELIPRDYFVTS